MAQLMPLPLNVSCLCVFVRACMHACVRVCLCAVDGGSSKTNSLKHNKQCSVWKLKMKVTDYARDQDLRAVGVFLCVREAMAGNLRGNRVWL